jgi:hypothetical protein
LGERDRLTSEVGPDASGCCVSTILSNVRMVVTCQRCHGNTAGECEDALAMISFIRLSGAKDSLIAVWLCLICSSYRLDIVGPQRGD